MNSYWMVFVLVFFCARSWAVETILTCESEKTGREIKLSLGSDQSAQIQLTSKDRKGATICKGQITNRGDVVRDDQKVHEIKVDVDFPKCVNHGTRSASVKDLRPTLRLDVQPKSEPQKGYRAFLLWRKNFDRSRCHVLTMAPNFL